MTVPELYRAVAELYGISSIFKYAKESDIQICYYEISGINTLLLIEGNEDERSRKIIETNTGADTQGSYLDNQHDEGDIRRCINLSLRANLLPSTMQDLDEFSEMIVIHELAHFIDQQHLTLRLQLTFNECDEEIGTRIETEAAEIADRGGAFGDRVHNKEFGKILNNLIRRRYTTLRHEKIKVAMSKTLVDDLDDTFYICD